MTITYDDSDSIRRALTRTHRKPARIEPSADDEDMRDVKWNAAGFTIFRLRSDA